VAGRSRSAAKRAAARRRAALPATPPPPAPVTPAAAVEASPPRPAPAATPPAHGRAAARQPAPAVSPAPASTAGPSSDGEPPHGLAVSFWFDSGQGGEPYPVRVRYVGRRVGATPPLGPRDSFVQEQTVDPVIPGSGPVSLSLRVAGLHPGDWQVTAAVQAPPDAGRGPGGPRRPVPSLAPAVWSWRRWMVATGPSAPVRARLAPLQELLPIPAVIPGSWLGLVTLGVLMGYVAQWFMLTREHVNLGAARLAGLAIIAAGLLSGKLYYAVVNRGRRRQESWTVGWCLQGALAGATVVGIGLYLLLGIPLAPTLDLSAPGVMLAIAVGRLGCFFTGCCAGRPTASRWGVWCSDRAIGARRIATQLLETLASLVISAIGFVVVLVFDRVGSGAVLLGGFAALTLFRQWVLPLRAEGRRTRHGPAITAMVSAAALVASIVVLAIGWTW
jgi:phosphatidylglycerol:prolipoprotein diacylglycerol transferase